MPNKVIDSKSSEGLSDQDQVEELDGNKQSVKISSYQSRKAAQSKREIMEKLSRERFPWEE